MTISEMRAQDVLEVAGLERQIFSMPWSEKSFLDSLALPDTLYLVVRDAGEIVGYCGFFQSFDEADITNVAVASKHRGRGVGHCMLQELMERGKARGIQRYTLEVRAGNKAALGLYRKLGFEAAGIRRNFYELPREDAVIMWTAPDEVQDGAFLSDSQ